MRAAAMESDSVFLPARLSRQDNLDLIDEEWARDCLSDDEVELAAENELPQDDAELEAALNPQHTVAEDDKWGDLGLDALVSGPP